MEASQGTVTPAEEQSDVAVSRGRAAAEAVANAVDSRDQPDKRKLSELDAETHQDALEWLLGDDDEEDMVKRLTVDVSGPDQPPHFITWTIRAIGQEEIKAARERARGVMNRADRRRNAAANDVDLSEVNLYVLCAATVDPDLVEAAQRKGVADPSVVVRHRFRYKPGVIDQLANECYAISGYEDDIIRDALELRTARG